MWVVFPPPFPPPLPPLPPSLISPCDITIPHMQLFRLKIISFKCIPVLNTSFFFFPFFFFPCGFWGAKNVQRGDIVLSAKLCLPSLVSYDMPFFYPFFFFSPFRSRSQSLAPCLCFIGQIKRCIIWLLAFFFFSLLPIFFPFLIWHIQLLSEYNLMAHHSWSNRLLPLPLFFFLSLSPNLPHPNTCDVWDLGCWQNPWPFLFPSPLPPSRSLIPGTCLIKIPFPLFSFPSLLPTFSNLKEDPIPAHSHSYNKSRQKIWK